MIAAVDPGRPSGPTPTPLRHFAEGATMMREKWPVYVGFAALCGIAGINGSVDAGRPDLALQLLSLRVTLLLALVAIVFVLPAAIRRIDPSFRMNARRFTVMVAMLVSVGAVVDLGVGLALLPGVIASVLLSQALLAALMRSSETPTPRAFVASVLAACRESYAMTHDRFATTLGIVLLPLAAIVVVGLVGVLAMLIAASWFPWSLYVSGPLLFLSIVYLECVRYSLLVWWYGKLRRSA